MADYKSTPIPRGHYGGGRPALRSTVLVSTLTLLSLQGHVRGFVCQNSLVSRPSSMRIGRLGGKVKEHRPTKHSSCIHMMSTAAMFPPFAYYDASSYDPLSASSLPLISPSSILGQLNPLQQKSPIHLPPEQQIKLAREVKTWAELRSKKEKAEEELGRKIDFAEWASLLKLSEDQLRWQIQMGKVSRGALITTNINLVKKMAASMGQRQEKSDLSMDDLVHEGTLGIIRAAEKFDPDRNIRFTTYATWWIRQTISIALSSHSSTVRLPILLQQRLKQVSKARAKLYLELEREPSSEELASEVNLPVKKVQKLRRSTRGKNYFQEEEIAMNMYKEQVLEEDVVPVSISEQEERLKRTKEALVSEFRDKTDKDILRMRLGLHEDDAEPLSSKAVAFHFNPKRIRKVERKLAELAKQKERDAREDVMNEFRLSASI